MSTLRSLANANDREPRILFVNASPRAAKSESMRIAEEFAREYTRARPRTHLDRVEVFDDLGPFGANHAEAKMAVIAGQPVPDHAVAEWEQVQELGARVRAADLLLFAVPMWNSGIPWALKLFVDIITQPGIAFRFSPQAGYEGLLPASTAVAVYASQVFAPGVPPAFGVDHQSTYLGWWLRFAGVQTVHELRLQPTYPTPDLQQRRAHALQQARRLAADLAPPEVDAAR